MPSDWGEIVPAVLMAETKEFFDEASTKPTEVIINNCKEVMNFNNFARAHNWEKRIRTLADLLEFVAKGGTCKEIAAKDIPAGPRDTVARRLKPINNSLKKLCKRIKKERERANVYKVKGIPETQLIMVDLTPFIPPSTLIDPTIRNEKVIPLVRKAPSDEVGSFAGMGTTTPDTRDPVPYTQEHFQFVRRCVGHLLRDFGKSQLLGSKDDPQLQDVYPNFLRTDEKTHWPQEPHHDYSLHSLIGKLAKQEMTTVGKGMEDEQ